MKLTNKKLMPQQAILISEIQNSDLRQKMKRPVTDQKGAVSLDDLNPVKTRRTFEGVSEQIRGAIASGQLKSGDRLPGERELAEVFVVSRTAVREALRMLESSGLIELRKGRNGGAVVRAGDAANVTQSIQDMVLLGSLPMSDLTEARIDITNAVIAHFCARATEEDYAMLERNVERTAKIGDDDEHGEELIDAAIEFHCLLAAGTHNKMFVIMIQATTSILRNFLASRTRYSKNPQANLIRSRRRLLKHLRARNVDAAQREMTKNLLELHNRVVGLGKRDRSA
ncbi:MAG: bacterial regulatory s, gntR family protein [Noviherbaspirillum sp.]|nr:bacterial regulatory s, gntR family protein [Noviherbaspirillum sp.]MDB5794122.1 bacterial regulatory s, gntR family protein [Noviherbaspirillum sp.]